MLLKGSFPHFDSCMLVKYSLLADHQKSGTPQTLREKVFKMYVKSYRTFSKKKKKKVQLQNRKTGMGEVLLKDFNEKESL